MEAIAELGNKVDQLDGKMEALFGRMSKEIKFAQAMQQYFDCEEKLSFAFEAYQVVQQTCLRREKQDPNTEECNPDTDLALNEKISQDCDIEQYKFVRRLENLDFEFNFNLFMRMLAGKSGVMGNDFWKAMLEANDNNYAEYDQAFNLLNQLAVQSTLVLFTYNIAMHKIAFQDVQERKLQEERNLQKERSPEDITLETYELLASMSDCRNCQKLSPEMDELYAMALEKHNQLLGQDEKYLDGLASEQEKC